MISRGSLSLFLLGTCWILCLGHVNCSSYSHINTSKTCTLYVAHQNRGILEVQFNPRKPANESLGLVKAIKSGFQPGWLCRHENNLYSVSRTHYPHNSSVSGGVFAFNRNNEGNLLGIGHVSSDGEGGVFCDISQDGRFLSVANIDGSTVSIHPRFADGRIGSSSHVFKYNLSQPGPGTKDSQIQSNPHQAVFDPSGQLMVVPDRGADRIYVYQVSSHTSIIYDIQLMESIPLPLGTGPRHVIFQVVDRSTAMMYLVSELDNTVRVFSITRCNVSTINNAGCSPPSPSTTAPSAFEIVLLQTASTLGPGSNRTAPNNEFLASELALSNDRRFLYVSNRNTISNNADNLAIFSVQHFKSPSQPLEYIGQSSTYGKIPRHFSLSQDEGNQYIAVANEVSNNLFVFRRNGDSGLLEEVVGNLTLGEFDAELQNGPMAVVWG